MTDFMTRTLLNNDGKYPFVVGFEPFELLRKGPLSQYSDGVPGKGCSGTKSQVKDVLELSPR